MLNRHIFQRRMPVRQRIEILHQPVTLRLAGRLRTGVKALPSKTKTLQRLGIDLHDDGIDLGNEASADSLLLVVAIDHAQILLAVAPVVDEERLVVDVALPLLRIGRTHQRLLAFSQQHGLSLMEILRRAADALDRELFVGEARAQIEKLKADPQAWVDYLRESSLTEVADGIN